MATRYDKLARNFAASVVLGAILIWWMWLSPEPGASLSQTRQA